MRGRREQTSSLNLFAMPAPHWPRVLQASLFLSDISRFCGGKEFMVWIAILIYGKRTYGREQRCPVQVRRDRL